MVKKLLKTDTVAIRIQPALKKALERLAEKDHRTLSSLIVTILAEHAEAQ
jgi:predicted transcriptional regulator